VVKFGVYKILLLLVMGFIFSGCWTISPEIIEVKPTEMIAQKAIVPLPSQESTIMTFFELINEKKVPEAISMMSIKAVPDDSTKQAWGVMFNDFDSVKVVNIEKTIQENLYKVKLAVEVNPRAANALFPYYGYGTNYNNIRFIKLVKDAQDLWKIEGIATGP
jgi:hypothetical protein